MRPEDREPAYLLDMLNTARHIHGFVEGVSLADFVGNLLLKMAVERGFSIIGEAASHISSETRAKHPQIPWKAIVGKRNIIVHDYYELDYERVYIAATKDIPELIANLNRILSVSG